MRCSTEQLLGYIESNLERVFARGRLRIKL